MILHSAVFWLWVSLALFVAVAGRFVARLALHTIDRWRADVDLHLSQASSAREKAERELAQAQQQLRDEVKDAKRIMEEARLDAESHRKLSQEKLKHTLALKEAMVNTHIAEAEAAALRQARAYATTLALKTSEEALRNNLGDDARDLLIEQAIDDIAEKTMARA